MTAPRCFGCIRVSTERQADEHRSSVADQRAGIETLAASLGVVVDDWFMDLGKSGATATGRPEFMRMVARCEASPRSRRDPGYVLWLNDSRFGRFPQPAEATYWREHLRKLGWVVRFVENDGIEDGMAREFVRLASSAQASEYLRNIKANATRGARGTAQQGFWASSAPFGYRRMIVVSKDRVGHVLANGVPKAKDEKVKLTPEPTEAAIVRDAFTRYAQSGETLHSVARWLTTVAPERAWSIPAVRWMMRNRAYVGDVVTGGRMADEDNPKHQVRRQTAERWGCDNAHDAIIDRKTFATVGAKLAKNAAAPRAAKGAYPLSGVLRCALCGNAMIGGRSKPKRGISWYRCAGSVKRNPVCPAGGAVARHLVEPTVIEGLTRLLTRPLVRSKIVAEIDKALAAFANPGTQSNALAKAEAKATERQRRLVASIASGTLTDAEAAPQMAEIRAELKRIEDARANARFLAARQAAVSAERDTIVAKVLEAPTILRTASGPALREQIAYWCSALTYNRNTRTVRMSLRAGLPLGATTDNSAAAAHPKHPTESAASLEVTVPSPRRRAANGTTGPVSPTPRERKEEGR